MTSGVRTQDNYNVLTMIMAKRFLPIVLSNTRIHSEISVQRILKICAVKVCNFDPKSNFLVINIMIIGRCFDKNTVFKGYFDVVSMH